jgi:hypothetical protein
MFLAAAPGGAENSGAGIKLAASANMIAILAAWTLLVINQNISPCEGWLILSLMHMLGVAGALAIYNTDLIIGEAFGLALICLTELWSDASGIWFWATLYETLPPLGTNGVVWFFTTVEVTGWFRIFALVVNVIWGAIDAISIGIGLRGYLELSYATWKIREDNLKWIDGPEMQAALEDIAPHEAAQVRKFQAAWAKTKKNLHTWAHYAWIVGAVTFVLTIPGAEMIIVHNGLSPQSELAQPGQLIPLTIGAIVFADGVLGLVRWQRLRKRNSLNEE